MPDAPPEPPTLTPVTGPLRVALYAAGMACLGLAYWAVLVPGLPTTPWLLAASWCFARSSPRMQRWLWFSPLFGVLIRDWYLHRGMRRKAKVVASAMITLACGFSLFGLPLVGRDPLPGWLRLTIAGCGLTGMAVIWGLVRTVRPAGTQNGMSSTGSTSGPS